MSQTLIVLPRAGTPPNLPELARAPSTLRAFIAHKRNATTRRGYDEDLRAFARFLGSGSDDDQERARRLLAADVIAVVAWRDSMESQGKKPATIARRLAALRTYYRFARAAGALAINPAELVETPKVEPARQHAPVLEAQQARRLLADCSGDNLGGRRDRAILGLLGSSGLRRCEVVGLDVADVRSETSGLVLVVTGKGGRTRTVDVDRATAEALTGYLEAAGRPLAATTAAGQGGALFRPLKNPLQGGRVDKPLSLRAVNLIVARHARAAELSAEGAEATPHALRRTFATVAIDRGASLEVLRRSMGHADVRTTARYDKRRESTLTVTY